MLRHFPPLLITASLDAGSTPQVALSDVHERTFRHMEGLVGWLKEPGVEKVVFAKNCSLAIRSEVLTQFAASHGKELEFVQVASSSRTSIQGKGYGEGDLIRQALDKSEVLRASRDFVKVTGKLFMPNAASVFRGEGDGEFFDIGNGATKMFSTRILLKSFYRSVTLGRALAALRKCRMPWELIAAVPSGWIDTRCYRVGVDFYRCQLLHTHERVQDALGYTLENAFFDDIHDAQSTRMINSEPVIVGASGTLGTYAGSFSKENQLEAREISQRLLNVVLP
jgi:hypothetical protein